MIRFTALVAAAIILGTLARQAHTATSVKGLLTTELRYYAAKDYRSLWNTQTVRYRTVCAYGPWLAKQKLSREQFPKTVVFELRNLRVRNYRGFSVAAYEVTWQGKLVAHAYEDVIVYEQGAWRDEIDGETAC